MKLPVIKQLVENYSLEELKKAESVNGGRRNAKH